MKNLFQTLFILFIVVSVTYYAKDKIRAYIPRASNNHIDKEKDLESRSSKLLMDPMYRPTDLISSISGYEIESSIKEINISQARLGNIEVDSTYFDGSGSDVLSLNGEAIYGGEGFIELGPVFRKSEIELIFFTTQSVGTCCGGYKALSLIRHINGIGFGLENVGIINSGGDDEESFWGRFVVKKTSLLIDLDVNELKRQFVEVEFAGGNKFTSKPLKKEPLSSKLCDFLWDTLGEYLKELKSRPNELGDIVDFAQTDLSNVGRQTFTHIQSTQTGFNKENYIKIGNKIASEKFLHKNLRPIFNRQVCGIK